MSQQSVEQHLSIVTILQSGEHLTYQNVLPPETDPAMAVAIHTQVRGMHLGERVARFVVVCGDQVQVREPGQEDAS